MTTAISIDFGYLPFFFPDDFAGLPLAVSNYPNLAELITAQNPEWVYAASPANRVFGLPKTHTLHHSHAHGITHLQFIVWSYGFFRGIRLTTEEAGFLDCTRTSTGQLDFIPMNFRDSKLLVYLSDFWVQHEQLIGYHAIESIIHLVFLARNRHLLEFESFQYRYMALDACYALLKDQMKATGSGYATHTQRIEKMCQFVGIPMPAWAIVTKDSSGRDTTVLAKARNPIFHEGLFNDQPLGFAPALDDDDVTRQMGNLVNRLLVFILLGPTSGKALEYIATEVTGRQRHGLDLSDSF